MIIVALVFTFVCIFGGFAIYIIFMQRWLAYDTSQHQSPKVFFLLSYLLSIPFFYGSMFLLMAIAKQLYPLFSEYQFEFAARKIHETTSNIATVFAALMAGLLSVIFWGWVLPKNKKN